MHYRQYYARFLTFQHRDFDMKGLNTQSMYTLELEQVFVDLRLDPKALHEANVDPLAGKPSAHLLAGQHAIWWYLEAEALQHQHLILLGPPGSGKTTLLKHLALTLVHPQKRRPLSRRLQRAYHTPFLLFLREHAQAIQNYPILSLMPINQITGKKGNSLQKKCFSCLRHASFSSTGILQLVNRERAKHMVLSTA